MLTGILLLLAAVAAAEDPTEHFETKVRPMFVKKCNACHTSAPQAGLRLDSRDAMITGGRSGAAIVPGDPDKSLLMAVLNHTHARIQMPPPGKLPQEELDAVALWIKQGAVFPASTKPLVSFRISDEQRAHWAFQPIASQPGATIDSIVRARLAAKKLKPAPQADRITLLRRVTYDLTGLPPTIDELDGFLSDRSPQAYEKVIDRLLASPRYGERWGRHWLDVVRYADTAGDSSDYPVPQAHKYRDWVIAAFNRDMPYDQFVREQLAGDLLPSSNEEQRWQRLIATGYVANTRRFSVVPERQMHLSYDDTIDNVGKAFLGLSVNCARCHDHKYDPISNKDYYALFGIFASTRYPFAGSENRNQQADFIRRKSDAEFAKQLAPIQAELQAIDAKLKQLEDLRKLYTERSAALRAGKEPPPLPEGAIEQTKIKPEYNKTLGQRMELLAKVGPIEDAYAVIDDKPVDAPVLLRGEVDKKGDIVERRFLEILGGQTLKDKSASGRRELADWILGTPIAARVMVNRVWQFHFGRGIVTTPNDFGKRGMKPTHPELLDYLASQFAQGGWSVKKLHRIILLSETYRQSSVGDAANTAVDPGNDLLWKFDRRRLDAESLRDSLLALGGTLDWKMGGEHPFPPMQEWRYTQHRPYAAVYESNQRSVYLMTQRIQRHPYLAMFDGADTNASTPARSPSITPIQALFQMNSKLVEENSEGFAAKLLASYSDDKARIDAAHRMATGRAAAPELQGKAAEYLTAAQRALQKAGVAEESHRRKALASYLRALLASNEFMFVD
ncbi:MAG: PSD1 domain-containing protein [Acidobacteria bacterium]|nr:PSD1 domain-containing protein [Acidobacteriota bacterium]